MSRLEQVFTPAWLGRVTGWAVEAARVEPLADELCMASTVARLHLAGDGLPATAIGKLSAADDLRELRFYRELAPGSGLAAPALYGGEVAGEHLALVMEDLAGFRLGDFLAGCGERDAERAVDALAAVHRRFWGAPPAWLPTYGDIAAQIAKLPGRLAAFEPVFGAGVDPGLLAGTRAIGDGLAPRLARLARRRTLIHVDCHLDNLAFDDAGDRAVVFDWQRIAAGSPALDLALFVVGSLEPGLRRRCEGGLVDRYHRALAAPDYPRAELDADYAAAIARLWIGNVNGLGWPEAAGWVGREAALARTGVARWSAAMVDHAIEL